MPYLGSLVIAIVALLVLAALVVGAVSALRRVGAAQAAVGRDLGERAAVLAARLAALRARREAGRARRTRPAAEAPTIEMARSDRGSTP